MAVEGGDEVDEKLRHGGVLSWGVTSLDRPGAANSSAALWSNGKTHDAAADQIGGAALLRRARRPTSRDRRRAVMGRSRFGGLAMLFVEAVGEARTMIRDLLSS
ncbi:hypothetical protein GCM10012286_79690 [Streptomyces lasiicapitis]|uniref:Uncharacterized protein n=1 Tax=Streptomyces lasiicapitis TaxID=1923961 RepID=A0ABQ2MVW9_9ACTN|nr:hypothetical protein GCM10012286_79690 [Streptomyces lasiicapitis]